MWVLLRAVVSQVAVTCSSLKACWQVQRLSSMRFWLEASLIPVHSGGVGGGALHRAAHSGLPGEGGSASSVDSGLGPAVSSDFHHLLFPL